MTVPDLPGPDTPSGRRANGLAAAQFGALVDLDPRLSEALLARLRGAGVAAYVEPAGNAQPLVRSVVLPSRPLDRLWVDPERADEAREVVTAEVADLSALLAEETPGATAHGLVQAVPRYAAHRVLRPPDLPEAPTPPAAPAPAAPTSAPPTSAPPTSAQPASALPDPGAEPDRGAVSPEAAPGPVDADELFRQIVAGFEQGSGSPVPPWPVSEDLSDGPSSDDDARSRSPEPERRSDRPAAPGADRRRRRRDDDALPDWLEPDALDEADLADPAIDGGHYTPPPPPAVPRPKGRTVLSALGVLVGLLLAFAPSLLGQVESTGTVLLGMALMVGGAVGLVTAVRDAPPDEQRPDDGAVV